MASRRTLVTIPKEELTTVENALRPILDEVEVMNGILDQPGFIEN